MQESKRVLDPMERISEVLFGLIIVLTFTCSFGFRRTDNSEAHVLLVQVIACSLAWGVIDAIFYLLGCFTERGHNLLLLRQVRETSDAAEAKRIIFGVLPPIVGALLSPNEYESLRGALKQVPEPPARSWLTKQDLIGGLGVFLLAFGSIFPVIIPFTFMTNARLALRVSNGIAILLLFLAGYALGRYSSPHPLRMAVCMVALGIAMVGFGQ